MSTKLAGSSLALSLLLLAVPLSSQVFPPSEIWVERGDPIPGVDLSVEPNNVSFYLGNDRVAFQGMDLELSRFGVFLADRDGVTELVGDRFWPFVGRMSYDGDWLVFDVQDPESDSGELSGLYLYADGTLARIIDFGSEAPGLPGTQIAPFWSVSVDDGTVVAAGEFVEDETRARWAIFRYTQDGGLETLLTDEAQVPGAGALQFRSFTDVVVSDGVVYFRGSYPGASAPAASTGIFALRDGVVERVALEGDPMPGGQPGEVFKGFGGSFLTASGGAVAFRGDGDQLTSGLFWNVNGPLEMAVSSRMRIPGGDRATFDQLGQPALSGDALVFEGDGILSYLTGRDLYLLQDGEVTRIVDAHCDERLITSESFRDGKVAFSRASEFPTRLRVAYLEAPAPMGESYTDPAFPGFRFTVRISAGGQTITTRDEPECQADALCIGGALEGRAEVTLRVLGPRDNGFYWPALARLTPSRVEVWIEQVSTGIVRYYLLEELPRDAAELPGLIDRRGFPAE